MSSDDIKFMRQALNLAKISAQLGEVPVGAVVVIDGQVVGVGLNRREIMMSCLEHAELAAIKDASCSLSSWRLVNATVYSTLEPCLMCAGALLHARVKRLVYGARDPKFGSIDSLYNLGADFRLNHQFEVCSGVLADESADLLKEFFRTLRAIKKSNTAS